MKAPFPVKTSLLFMFMFIFLIYQIRKEVRLAHHIADMAYTLIKNLMSIFLPLEQQQRLFCQRYFETLTFSLLNNFLPDLAHYKSSAYVIHFRISCCCFFVSHCLLLFSVDSTIFIGMTNVPIN